jgi:hypothetical protein
MNVGIATLHASQFTENTVTWAGGGIFVGSEGTLFMDSSTISDNSSDVFGGGIMNHGTLTINNQ